MSIMHLLVRRHAMAPSPGRHRQRGCALPPFPRNAIALDAAYAQIALPETNAGSGLPTLGNASMRPFSDHTDATLRKRPLS